MAEFVAPVNGNPINTQQTIQVVPADVVMGEKHKVIYSNSRWATTKKNLTNVVHFSTCAYLLLVLVLCFVDEFTFFTWHPILLSIGWTFLMTEGVLFLSKDSFIASKIRHSTRIKSHWISLVVAVVLILVGFLIAFINKNRLNKQHFKSWHALLGFIGIIASIPTCLNGVAVLYKVELKHYIKPKILKFIHIASGVFAIIFGGISLILSVYTKWFQRRTDNNTYVFTYGLICVSFTVIWILVKPTVSCYKFIEKALQR